jgi:TPR repeat protein
VLNDRFSWMANMAPMEKSPAASTAALFLCLLILAGIAIAGPLEVAAAANLHDDYSTSLRLLRLLADEGNATAQNALGAMYAEK